MHNLFIISEPWSGPLSHKNLLCTRTYAVLMLELMDKRINEALGEVCPKCHSPDIGVWSFNEVKVNYGCKVCRYKRTALRLDL